MGRIEINPKSPPPREIEKVPRREPNPPIDPTARMAQERKPRRDGRN